MNLVFALLLGGEEAMKGKTTKEPLTARPGEYHTLTGICPHLADTWMAGVLIKDSKTLFTELHPCV